MSGEFHANATKKSEADIFATPEKPGVSPEISRG
jgi:hypothetical protein